MKPLDKINNPKTLFSVKNILLLNNQQYFIYIFFKSKQFKTRKLLLRILGTSYVSNKIIKYIKKDN